MAIETKYVKLTHREQILLRPDTYIGSIQNEEREYWTLNKETNKIEFKSGIYNPGYIKIFDEILTNASDHAIRTGKVTTIQIKVDANSISIENDGPGIPITLHEIEKVYIPELIFGHLLTSENYNDSEERFVGGRNGYGAKLCAIFSKKFVVETCDGKKKYHQEFYDNLLLLDKPNISNAKKQFTRITYFPDFEKFDMVENDDNIISILHKRAADIAAYNPKVEVYFNDERLNVRKFDDYVNLFGMDEVFYAKISENWEIAVTNGKNTQVSLVNGIATNSGGTHVNYITNLIAGEIKTYLYKKIKGCNLTLPEIKSKFMIFVCCKIGNPTFETQTKETLTTKITSEITKEFKYTDAYIKKIFKSSIVESILDWYDQKQNAEANKLARDVNKNLSKLKVEKLIDAKGDGKDRTKCSLALFEGDCLHEDTLIRVLRDGDIIDTKIKYATTEDLVITHNNTISNIYAFTKKIKKKATIKINGEEIICSHEHKWFIYDKETNEFRFELTKNIDKLKHKLIKNYLAFTDALLVIESNDGYILKLKSGEIINTNPEHQFAIYNREENKFEMKKNAEIDIYNHFLINTFKL